MQAGTNAEQTEHTETERKADMNIITRHELQRECQYKTKHEKVLIIAQWIIDNDYDQVLEWEDKDRQAECALCLALETFGEWWYFWDLTRTEAQKLREAIQEMIDNK